jgi:hypothetical protein
MHSIVAYYLFVLSSRLWRSERAFIGPYKSKRFVPNLGVMSLCFCPRLLICTPSVGSLAAHKIYLIFRGREGKRGSGRGEGEGEEGEREREMRRKIRLPLF